MTLYHSPRVYPVCTLLLRLKTAESSVRSMSGAVGKVGFVGSVGDGEAEEVEMGEGGQEGAVKFAELEAGMQGREEVVS